MHAIHTLHISYIIYKPYITYRTDIAYNTYISYITKHYRQYIHNGIGVGGESAVSRLGRRHVHST